MKKLLLSIVTIATLCHSCTTCYNCSENGTGVNSFKACEDHPDYDAAREAAKTGTGYMDSINMAFYKCR